MIAEERVGTRSRVWSGALVAGFGPFLPVLVLAVAGHRSWYVEGGLGAFLLFGFAWLAGWGLLGAAIARTSPFAIGALAGEATAIGSLFGPGLLALIAAGMALGSGVVGGAAAVFLAPPRTATQRDKRAVRVTAVLVALAMLGPGMVGGWRSAAQRARALRPQSPHPSCYVDRGPGPPSGPLTGWSLTPDRVAAAQALHLRAHLRFTPAQLQGARGYVSLSLVVNPESGKQDVRYGTLIRGQDIRPDMAVDEELPPLGVVCGHGGLPRPGRYQAMLEVHTEAETWITTPVPLTIF